MAKDERGGRRILGTAGVGSRAGAGTAGLSFVVAASSLLGGCGNETPSGAAGGEESPAPAHSDASATRDRVESPRSADDPVADAGDDRGFPPPARPGTGSGTGGSAAGPMPAPGSAPDEIPELVLQRTAGAGPIAIIDQEAYTAFCQANDLPQPPDVEAIDAVGYAMIHAAVEAVAGERTVPALARLAFLYDGNEAPAKAIAIYRELIERSPEEFAFHHLLGRALVMVDRRPEALEAFRRATGIRADIAATWYRQGELELAAGEPDAARASFDRYAALRPDDGLADFAIGRLDATAGRYEDALPRLEAAVDARPDLAPAWLLLAQARARTGDSAGARAATERGRALAGASAVGLSDPVETEMYRQAQSVAYLQAAMKANDEAGRPEEAYRLALMLSERRPGNPLVTRNLAVLAKRLGRLPEAVAHAERAAELEPDRPRNLTTLAELYRDVGRTAEAVEAARRAVRLDPDSEVPHVVLAGALMADERLEEALEAADEALQRAPDRLEALAVRAAILGSLGRLDDARETVDRVLGLDPGNRWATALLAELDRREAAAAGDAPPTGGG